MSTKQFADRVINRALLKPLGLKLAYRIGTDPIEDMVSLMRDRPVSVVIDGGAYEGNFGRGIIRAFPAAAIHAFEPTPASYALLEESVRSIAAIECHQMALGSITGTATLFVNSSPLTNSLLKNACAGEEYFSKLVAERGSVAVEVTTLSDFAQKYGLTALDIVKLDLQGNELEAIRGMDGLIDRVQIIHSEVQFVALYEGAPLFADIESYLRHHGLVFYQFYDMVRSPDDGRLIYADATFVRDEILSQR